MKLPHVPKMARALYEGAGNTISAATHHATGYAKSVGNYVRENKGISAFAAMSVPVALSGAYAMTDRPAVVREAKELGGEAAKYWEGVKDSVMAKAYAAECAEVAAQQNCGVAPFFYWVSDIGGKKVVKFNDDVAPGMRAFAETGNQTIELGYFTTPMADGAAFVIPAEMLAAPQFNVTAIDRNGNRSEPKPLYVVEGLLTAKKPEASTMPPSIRWFSNDIISYSDDFSTGARAYAEANGETIELKTTAADYDTFYVDVPSQLLSLGQFDVRAVDRDGNERRDTFYIYDGVMTKKKPAASAVGPRFLLTGYDMMSFEDDLAAGMKAYAELHDGGVVELKPFAHGTDFAYFYVPDGAYDVPEFRVRARDRDGNESGSTTIYVVDRVLTARKPTASTVAPSIFWFDRDMITYSDDMTAGIKVRAESDYGTIDLTPDIPEDTLARVSIPPELLNVPQFDVVATDRDGNNRRTTFYVYDGVPSTVPPCEPAAYEIE